MASTSTSDKIFIFGGFVGKHYANANVTVLILD
jgi:hypothetical protein